MGGEASFALASRRPCAPWVKTYVALCCWSKCCGFTNGVVRGKKRSVTRPVCDLARSAEAAHALVTNRRYPDYFVFFETEADDDEI